MEQFARTALLIGQEGVEKLHAARVAVFGIGGVGGHATESLVRCGVGTVDIFDDDRVSLTNLNRQLIATHDTIGRPKVEAMAERLHSINPRMQVNAHQLFYMPDQAENIDFSAFDYILDCIDTVTAKLDLVCRAHALGVPIISAMGAGNRMDPTRLRVGDIYETQNCPLARVMRRELRKRGIPALKVVYSTEPALSPRAEESDMAQEGLTRRAVPGSMAFVPPVMGMIMASVVVRDLLGR